MSIPVPFWQALPLVLRADFPGGARERLVTLALMMHADCVTGRAHPSVRRLAAVTGCGKNAVGRALRALAAAGVIECEARAGRRGSYKLVLPTVEQTVPTVGTVLPPAVEQTVPTVGTVLPLAVEQTVPTVGTNCPRSGDKLSPQWGQNLEKELKKEPRREGGARATTEKPPPRSGARPASVEEVRAYMAKLGVQTFTAERFYDWHEARGWQLKSGPVKDWRACVRTWARRDGEQQAKAPRLDAQRAEVPRPGEQRAVVLRPGEHIEGLCGGCGRPSSLTICEACQLAAWGVVEMREAETQPHAKARVS